MGLEEKMRKICYCLVLLMLTACGRSTDTERLPTSNSEICRFVDHGFLHGLDGVVDTASLPYSLAEFEELFWVSKKVTGRLYLQGVELGKEYLNNTDEEIDAARELSRDACMSLFTAEGKWIRVKPKVEFWVAVIGEENQYRSGEERFETTYWKWDIEVTREQCEKFLASVRGDAIHGVCITRDQWDAKNYPWWVNAHSS